MKVKSVVSATAVALVAGLGSASAADQFTFTALAGITAEPLNAVELDSVIGTFVDLRFLGHVPSDTVGIVVDVTFGIPVAICPPRRGCHN